MFLPPALTTKTNPATPQTKQQQQTTKQQQVGDGVEGYYCLECTPGTTTNNCQTVGGSCVVDTGDLPTPNPAYKKLKETHFGKIGSYHAKGDVSDDDDEGGDMPGVDPVAGYKKVKYSFKSGDTVEDGGHKGDEGDDDRHDGGKGGHGGKGDKGDDDKGDDDKKKN